MSRDYCEGDFCYQKKARTSCLKPEVWSILHKVAARVGRLEITSGCDGKHAKRSYHYSGRAVDFRPMQASASATLGVLRGMPEVGGIGSYGNGLLHADVRPTRIAWHGKRTTRVAAASTAAPARVASAGVPNARLASARMARTNVAYARYAYAVRVAPSWR
jgi:hypothetical protein